MSGRKKGEAEGGREREEEEGVEENVRDVYNQVWEILIPMGGYEWTGVGTGKEYVYLQSDL